MLETILKFPLSFIWGLCLLLFLAAGTFFGSAYVSIHDISFFLVIAILALLQKSILQKFLVFLLSLFLFGVYLLFELPTLYLLIAELFMLAFCCFLQQFHKSFVLFSILASAFFCHLFYIQTISVTQYQHDLNGILVYMNMISLHGVNWKYFDPWSMYYLFHQPLLFIIQAFLYRFSLDIWNSVTLAQETLQYLSLFFVTGTSIITAAILKELKLSSRLYYFALLLFTFNPTLFLFSGYISDDTSVLFWGCCVIYFAIKWFNSEKTRYIILCAVCFALGVLTKLSLLMLVPALAFMFLYKLFRKQFSRLVWTDLNFFIIIAVPLALSWIVRNHILFDMQFYNVPDTSPNGQNFYNLSFSDRIFDFSQLFIPFIQAPDVVDANMWLALIKTELFGEWNMAFKSTYLIYPIFFLYFFNMILKIFVFSSLCFILYKTFRQKITFNPLFFFFAILYLTLWCYSFKYALDYPYVCSSDFRLFALLMLPEIAILSFTLDKFFCTSQQKKANFLLAFSIIYSVLACIIYTYGL